MRAFTCGSCGQLVFFENSACLRCGAELGFDPTTARVVTVDRTVHRRCANTASACNWLVSADHHHAAALCASCRLTRTLPASDDPDTADALVTAEAAKRRLVFQLHDLCLPVVGWMDEPDGGLAFDLLSSRSGPVSTGHADGVITLDLAESDDAHRASRRAELDEPYRTVLGHFRHEIGHYYWSTLVKQVERVDEFRRLFGDERADYAAALARHYERGAAPGWRSKHVSAYATAHPWEDWAETFAHYLHIRDALQTAAAHGIHVDSSVLRAEPTEATDATDFGALLDEWLPLTYALNAVNRSMGRADLYPFVLAPAVISKLTWVHNHVRRFLHPSGGQRAPHALTQ
jgi:hypothetical protein